jgi:uncharacterized membrane protein
VSWVWAVARLLGLSTTAGVRASMTLLIVGVLSREGWGFQVPPRFTWMESSTAIAIFVVLAIIETSIDKMQSLDRIQDRLTLPWRIAAGAIVGGAAMGHGVPGLVIGLVGGGFLAWFGLEIKRLWRPRSSTSSMTLPVVSLVEDLVAFVADVLTATLAPFGYAIAAWAVWFYLRLRRRRVAKYKGLRVLND